jgi:hypothetical protein
LNTKDSHSARIISSQLNLTNKKNNKWHNIHQKIGKMSQEVKKLYDEMEKLLKIEDTFVFKILRPWIVLT